MIVSDAGVYAIVNVVSGKRYVGSTVNIDRRLYEHVRTLRLGAHHCRKLQMAWSKYGEPAFGFEILEMVARDRAALLGAEQKWMARCHAVDNGYNISPTAGSRLGETVTAEARANMSAALSGRSLSAQHRAALSAGRTGYKYKQPHSMEMREKISTKLKGRKWSPEAVAKRWQTRRERYGAIGFSEAARSNMASLGHDRMRGYKWTPEALAKREATRRSTRAGGGV